jgi:kinesin family protein C1
MAAPIYSGSMKHKPSGCKDRGHCNCITMHLLTGAVPEPQPTKLRKTLQERAAEPLSSKQPAPPNSRPVNQPARNGATNGVRGLAASTSRMPSTNSSRHAPQPPYGNSIGHGGRAPGANLNHLHRSKSAYGHNRSKSHHQGSLPPSSMAKHEDEQRSELKGAYPFSISTNPKESQDFLKVPKNKSRVRHVRILSDVSRSRNLSGTPTRSSSSPAVNRPASLVIERPTDTDCSVLESFGDLSLGSPAPKAHNQRIGRGTTSGKNLDISFNSKFPSSIPRATPVREMGPPPLPLCIWTPTRTPKDHTPSNPQVRFLSRFANTLAPVFDTESRMEAMEREFTAFKQKMEGETTQSGDLKESIRMLQSRGMASTYSRSNMAD